MYVYNIRSRNRYPERSFRAQTAFPTSPPPTPSIGPTKASRVTIEGAPVLTPAEARLDLRVTSQRVGPIQINQKRRDGRARSCDRSQPAGDCKISRKSSGSYVHSYTMEGETGARAQKKSCAGRTRFLDCVCGAFKVVPRNDLRRPFVLFLSGVGACLETGAHLSGSRRYVPFRHPTPEDWSGLSARKLLRSRATKDEFAPLACRPV